MIHTNGGRSGLLDTIGSLRLCNALQSEVIANMEQYQNVVAGGTEREARSGRRFGYEAELSYLHERREALNALIAAVEKYCAASVGAVPIGRPPGA
jgi:hypothetical protein